MKRIATLAFAAALAMGGCDGGDDGTDAGVMDSSVRTDGGGGGDDDAGGGGDTDGGGGDSDAGCALPELIELADESMRPGAATCPSGTGVPDPGGQMGSCCFRRDQSDRLDAPELKLNYLHFVEPAGSGLTAPTFRTAMQEALDQERLLWLIQLERAGADGDIGIRTGMARRGATGLYRFSEGALGPDMDPARWLPATLNGTIGSDRFFGASFSTSRIVIPIFAADRTTVQADFPLRDTRFETAQLGVNRTCVGWTAPGGAMPGGILNTFIMVDDARTRMVDIPPISTTVCGLVAGSLDDPSYCDADQSTWNVPPDAICDSAGCRFNAPCMADNCDPATECNAWHVVAEFAAAGVEIAP